MVGLESVNTCDRFAQTRAEQAAGLSLISFAVTELESCLFFLPVKHFQKAALKVKCIAFATSTNLQWKKSFFHHRDCLGVSARSWKKNSYMSFLLIRWAFFFFKFLNQCDQDWSCILSRNGFYWINLKESYRHYKVAISLAHGNWRKLSHDCQAHNNSSWSWGDSDLIH